jgi:peptidoglycan L-alanyl-D-glutamate endopeptidase CwlK
MPQFGTKSREVLDTVRPELVETMEIVVAEFNISALEGRRSWDRQAELLRQNKTKVGPGESKHNPPKLADGTEDQDWLSNAIDVVPYPIDWKDAKRFIYMAGMVIGVGRALGHDLRWGGNWDEDQVIIDDQNFDDLPHFEYKGPFAPQ